MLNGLGADLAAASRSLSKNPSYAIFSILCLALGIGATTAVFSVVNAFLLRPLPFHEPSRLVNIWMSVEGAEGIRYFVEGRDFTELQRTAKGIVTAAVQQVDLNLTLEAEPRRIQGVYATSNLFEVLGIPLLAGRFFERQEEQAEAKVCVVSEELWRGQLGASEVVDSKLYLNGLVYLIVGIAPRGSYPDQAQVWIPVTRAVRQSRDGFSVVGRLQVGTSLDAARQELDQLAEHLRQKYPLSNSQQGLEAGDLNRTINQPELESNLWTLLTVVGFLLAIACANVASLLLVRLHQQKPELAVRAALGAGRQRLLRRVLVESLLLALLGAALGVVLAVASAPALVALSPAQLPRFREIGLDLRVLAFAAALTMTTLLCSSLLPAWRAARSNPALDMRQSERGNLASLSAFQRLLVIADVALALALLAGAGLMLTSFWRLQNTPAGFDPEDLYRARMVAPAARAETHQGRSAFIQEVEERIQALPFIEAVGASHSFPLGGIPYSASLLLEGGTQKVEEAEQALFQVVTPGFFQVMRLPPLLGRTLDGTDATGRRPVVVVSQAFARRFWPGEDPIGKRLRLARSADKNAWWTVVGVVADQKDRGLAGKIGPSLYFPQKIFERAYTAKMDLFVRASPGAQLAAAAIRRAVHGADPSAMFYDLAAMPDLMAETLQRERFSAALTAILAGLALTLAGAGIYGVISYGVNQRKRELGVRMAFGARRGDIKRLVVAQSLKVVGAGILLGNLAALGLGRLIASQLYQTAPHDPKLLAIASLVILATALLASYFPARLTSRLDPTQALRS